MRSEHAVSRAAVLRGDGGEPYLVKRAPARPGRFAFRVSFLAAPDEVRETLVSVLEGWGCRLEWFTSDLFRVDASREALAQQVSGLLMHVETLGHLTFEDAR